MSEAYDSIFGAENGLAALAAVSEPAEKPVEAVVETPEPVVEPVVEKEPTMVPLAGLEAERAKRQAAEKELEALRNAAPGASEPSGGAPNVEPAAIDTSKMTPEQVAEMRTINVKLGLSEEMARTQFGDDLVDKAGSWATGKFATDPAFTRQVLQHQHPYKYAIELYNESLRTDAALDNDLTPEQIKEALALYREKNPPTPASEVETPAAAITPAPAPKPARVAPPTSIVEAPAARGTSPTKSAVGEGVAYQDLFG